MNERDFREILAQEFLATARWRRETGGRHPADRRHAAGARALEALASHVRALPEDDARLARLSRQNADAEFFHVGDEATRHEIEQFGFSDEAAGEPPDVGAFLDRLAAAAEADEADHARRLAHQPARGPTEGR